MIFPALGTNGLLAFIVSSSILWLFTLINLKGVKEAGFVGIVTTVAKISVLIVVIAVAFWGFSFDNFYTVSAAELSGFGSIPVAVAITLWSYIGLESASVTGGEIKNPARNIKLSTILGFSITAVIYILTSFAAMGAMPQSELANSTAPMSDIINRISGGTWGGWFISAVVPAMVCFCLMPLLVYKLLDPELKRTPEAKAMGKQALGELGSMSSNEKKVAFGFVLALVGWGTSLITGLSATSARMPLWACRDGG